RAHLPGARGEAEGLGDQCPHGAQVDDVSRELVVHGALYISTHRHVLAAADHAELLHAGNLFGEAYAAAALDAARHIGGDEGAQAVVRDRALALVVAGNVAAEAHRQVLQLALPALVADRAVERVVDEQELHGGALRTDGTRGP